LAPALLVALISGLAAPDLAAVAEDDPGARLEDLRQRIGKLQRQLERDADRRDKEAAGLRDAERVAAAAARELQRTRAAIADHRTRLARLGQEKEASQARLESQRHDLAVQVRAAYVGGRQERLRMVLNQQDPSLLGRLLVYYGYLNRYRAGQIDTVAKELSRLASLEQELAEATRELEALENQRQREAAEVEQARLARATAVAELETRIESGAQQMARLESEEQAVLRLIEELQKALAEMPGTQREPFADQRGKLAWPVKGRLLHDFGQPRAGGSLRWNGVLVSADRGAEVRAVYHGRVAYADWLPGMGLLLVLEHGDGYLSLYGHNDVLFKDVGDWVQPGEVIAAAGDSGGRTRAALYFELRRGKQPQNPHRWFNARLSSR
jgi:septal ring factor EnvC (AmiA/AmiB activator)